MLMAKHPSAPPLLHATFIGELGAAFPEILYEQASERRPACVESLSPYNKRGWQSLDRRLT